MLYYFRKTRKSINFSPRSVAAYKSNFFFPSSSSFSVFDLRRHCFPSEFRQKRVLQTSPSLFFNPHTPFRRFCTLCSENGKFLRLPRTQIDEEKTHKAPSESTSAHQSKQKMDSSEVFQEGQIRRFSGSRASSRRCDSVPAAPTAERRRPF